MATNQSGENEGLRVTRRGVLHRPDCTIVASHNSRPWTPTDNADALNCLTPCSDCRPTFPPGKP